MGGAVTVGWTSGLVAIAGDGALGDVNVPKVVEGGAVTGGLE